jgi:deoxyribonuclease-4
MPLLGAHMSIAGGHYKAVEAAAKFGMDVVQIFTKNNNQWRAKPLVEEDTIQFQQALASLKIQHPIAHSSYLINLAAPTDDLWRASIESLIMELERAGQLGVPYLVVHPGAFTTTSEEIGIRRIATAIDEAHQKVTPQASQILLENTAGQGSALGWKFEQLAEIIAQVHQPKLLGLCFDTCHAFAAGYPLSSAKEFRETMARLDDTIGLGSVKAIHVNDSKRELGSRVDRHEHIGRGQIGIEAFRRLLRDPRFANVPMYLETPKGKEGDEELDAINLRTLRGLLKE